MSIDINESFARNLNFDASSQIEALNPEPQAQPKLLKTRLEAHIQAFPSYNLNPLRGGACPRDLL